MLGFGRQELLERLEFRSWVLPWGSASGHVAAKGEKGARGLTDGILLSSTGPFIGLWVLNPVVPASFQVE